MAKCVVAAMILVLSLGGCAGTRHNPNVPMARVSEVRVKGAGPSLITADVDLLLVNPTDAVLSLRGADYEVTLSGAGRSWFSEKLQHVTLEPGSRRTVRLPAQFQAPSNALWSAGWYVQGVVTYVPAASAVEKGADPGLAAQMFFTDFGQAVEISSGRRLERRSDFLKTREPIKQSP